MKNYYIIISIFSFLIITNKSIAVPSFDSLVKNWNSLIDTADIYIDEGNHAQANQILDSILNQTSTITPTKKNIEKLYTIRADAFLYKGLSQRKQGNFQKAVFYLVQNKYALKQGAIKDYKRNELVLTFEAEYLRKIGKYNEAISKNEKSLKIIGEKLIKYPENDCMDFNNCHYLVLRLRELANLTNIGNTYIDIGLEYKNKKLLDSAKISLNLAEKYLTNARNLCDSLLKLSPLANELKINKIQKGRIYNLMHRAGLLELLGNYEEAKELYAEALNLSKEYGLIHAQFDSKSLLVRFYLISQKPLKAKELSEILKKELDEELKNNKKVDEDLYLKALKYLIAANIESNNPVSDELVIKYILKSTDQLEGERESSIDFFSTDFTYGAELLRINEAKREQTFKFIIGFLITLVIILVPLCYSLYKRTQKLTQKTKDLNFAKQDITHRMKNMLQVLSSKVSSIIELNVTKEKNLALKEIEGLIKANFSLQKILYDTKSNSKVELQRYFPNLFKILESVFKSEGGEFEKTTELQSLPKINQAKVSRLAWAICELTTNSFKYTDSEKKKIALSAIKTDNNYIKISVADNGSGFTPDTTSDSFGLESVKIIVEEQLKGKVDIIPSPQGTTIDLNIPITSLN